MTRRDSLHSLAATALLAATPALPLTAGAAPVADVAFLAQLRELAAKVLDTQNEKVRSIQERDYEWAARMRNRELALQSQITELLLGQA